MLGERAASSSSRNMRATPEAGGHARELPRLAVAAWTAVVGDCGVGRGGVDWCRGVCGAAQWGGREGAGWAGRGAQGGWDDFFAAAGPSPLGLPKAGATNPVCSMRSLSQVQLSMPSPTTATSAITFVLAPVHMPRYKMPASAAFPFPLSAACTKLRVFATNPRAAAPSLRLTLGGSALPAPGGQQVLARELPAKPVPLLSQPSV